MANLTPTALIAIAVGIGILALLIGYFIGTRFGGKKSVAMREASEKHDGYKNDVREHFEQTSAIMSRMVEDYRDMYRHMADGAEKLADIHPEKQITPPPQPEAITAGLTGDSAGNAADKLASGPKADGKARDKDKLANDPAGIKSGETLGAADPAKANTPPKVDAKDSGVKEQPKTSAGADKSAGKSKDSKPASGSSAKPVPADKRDRNTAAHVGKKPGAKKK